MKQEEHETVNQFRLRLSNQAANCELDAMKNVIKLLINASPQSFSENFWERDKS